MFFKCDSFFLKPIGDATPDYVTVIMMYAVYIAIHVLPFLPSYISNVKSKNSAIRLYRIFVRRSTLVFKRGIFVHPAVES